MKRLFLITTFLTLSCIPTFAQREVGRGELSWQYSFLSREVERVNIPTNPNLIEREKVPLGFGVTVSGNLTRSVAIIGDASYNWNDSSNFSIKSRDFIFLSGPRFYIRGDSFSVFGQVLAGASRRTDQFFDQVNSGQIISIKDTNFALGFGGGADITLSNRVSLRVFQFDFIPTRSNNVWLKNYRFKTGIVFRFDYFK
jgi:Outer membrane protein beta-barrel domain